MGGAECGRTCGWNGEWIVGRMECAFFLASHVPCEQIPKSTQTVDIIKTHTDTNK